MMILSMGSRLMVSAQKPDHQICISARYVMVSAIDEREFWTNSAGAIPLPDIPLTLVSGALFCLNPKEYVDNTYLSSPYLELHHSESCDGSQFW